MLFASRKNRTSVCNLQDYRNSHYTIEALAINYVLFQFILVIITLQYYCHIITIQLLGDSNPFYLREGQKYYLYTKEPLLC
jgi:hypothetical protein